jgi:hypothetical protein
MSNIDIKRMWWMIENNYGQGVLEVVFNSEKVIKISNENAQHFLCVSLSCVLENEMYTHIESFLNDYHHLLQKETINKFNITKAATNFVNKRKTFVICHENECKTYKKLRI